MTVTYKKPPSKIKNLAVFILTIIIGYGLFILPDIFFGITKINGGKIGTNLLLIGLFQFLSIFILLSASLKVLRKDFEYIGLEFSNLKYDVLLGLFFGVLWTVLQFVLIIPSTGGKDRSDISAMLNMYDGSLIGTISFLVLGVIGGGITEEVFNRGYFISILKDVFKNPTFGIWISAILSIISFSLGHLPNNSLAWFDILVPSIIYTFLFLSTKRLTASIVAHGIYNMSAILLTYYIYHP